jgi:alpha/beta superfamily hydrolase
MVFIPAADHFFQGHLDKMAEAVRDWISARHRELKLVQD